MATYERLGNSEGARYFAKVWTLDFRPLSEDNFFVEPWRNRATADCAEFRLNGNGGSEILFFVADPKLAEVLENSSESLYAYGAYNQINVCQMRAKGTVSRVESHPETEKIKERLRNRIAERVPAIVDKLRQDEADERFAILDRGQMFCFQPIEYAYAVYQRG